jgi:hypothetical protein
MKMHPDLKKPSRVKKIPSSTVVYEKELHPLFTDDLTKLQELITQERAGFENFARHSRGTKLFTKNEGAVEK